MTLSKLAKQAEKLITDNSPLILTAIGVTGTITTAYLTGRASFKAAEIIAEAENESYGFENRPLDIKEKVNLTWKLYLPAIGVGSTTIVCIVGANRIGTRRAAAMAAAYSLSEKAFTEYKDKVAEKIGAIKETKIRDSIAQDKVDQKPVTQSQVIVTSGGEVLCFDVFSGRYFMSSMEALKKAQNDLNYQINNNYYASLSDFYDLLGLQRIPLSDDVGWNSDQLLELSFTTTMSDDQRPCLAINFHTVPVRNYFRLN